MKEGEADVLTACSGGRLDRDGGLSGRFADRPGERLEPKSSRSRWMSSATERWKTGRRSCAVCDGAARMGDLRFRFAGGSHAKKDPKRADAIGLPRLMKHNWPKVRLEVGTGGTWDSQGPASQPLARRESGDTRHACRWLEPTANAGCSRTVPVARWSQTGGAYRRCT